MNRSLPCPDCGEHLPEPVPAACPSCGIRLGGPLAGRLWALDQELVTLELRREEIRGERTDLIAVLHGPPTAAEARPTLPSYDEPRPSLAPLGAPLGVSVPPAATVSRRSLSVQQVLLGLGAVLLLSALGFFGLVMWLIVGVWGQAVILLVLTGGAAGAVVAFNRRALAAAAETFALIAAGLLLMDAVALRSFGLLGLDDLAGGWFWGIAAAVGAVLLLVVDRAAGTEPRRLISLRPLAALAAVAVPWSIASASDADGIGVPLLLGGVALVNAATAAAIHRGSHRGQHLGQHRSTSLPFLIAVLGTSVALLGYELAALVLAYDLGRGLDVRYLAWALALIPLVGLVAALVRLRDRRLAIAVVVGALVCAGVPLLDAPWWALPGVALVAAVIVLTVPSTTARAIAIVVGVVTYPILLILTVEDVASLTHLITSGGDTTVPAIAAMTPPLVALVALGLAGWRQRTDMARLPWFLAGALVPVFATELAFLLEREAGWWYAVGLTDVVVLGLLAAVAVLRGHAVALPAELICLAGLLVSALVTYGFAVGLDDEDAGWHLVLLFAVLGLGGLAYACLPGRFLAAYVGCAFVSAGWWTFLATRHDGLPVELSTLPAAGVLALVGVAQGRRFRRRGAVAPTLAVVGPALALALLPSVQVGLADDDALRLGLVTAVAVVVVLVGIGTRTLAPVVVGGIAVLEIALLQGGPYLGVIPFWITGGVAGAVLLIAGVRWESTVASGKRSAAWFESLR